LTLFAIGGTAAAADLSRPVYKPVPPPPLMQTWTGFYLGVNAGGGIGTGSSDFSIAGVPAFASVYNQLQGAIGGGRAGFNWQAGAAVLGVEADFQASGLKGRRSPPVSARAMWRAVDRHLQSESPLVRDCARPHRLRGERLAHLCHRRLRYARLETDASATAFRRPRRSRCAGPETLDRRHRHRVRVRPALERQAEYLYFDFGHTNSSLILSGLPTINDDAT
jgi:hypothetical protein